MANIVKNWSVSSDKPVVVENYDKVAVKNGLDDMLRSHFTSKYQVKETFMTRDTRLIICFIACLFSGFACLWDYLHPFPESRMVLAVCSLSYFTITGLLYVWEWFVERGTFFEGEINGGKMKLSSYIPRYSGNYTLTGESVIGGLKTEYKFTKCISTWIDVNGTILPHLVEKETEKIYSELFKAKAQ